MQKLQILFPDPMMRQLRRLAESEDRPVSEIVRRAVERLLEQSPGLGIHASGPRRFPTFSGGPVKVSASELKQLLYENDHP